MLVFSQKNKHTHTGQYWLRQYEWCKFNILDYNVTLFLINMIKFTYILRCYYFRAILITDLITLCLVNYYKPPKKRVNIQIRNGFCQNFHIQREFFRVSNYMLFINYIITFIFSLSHFTLYVLILLK